MEDTLITFETAKLAKKKGFLKEWADLAYKKDDQKLYGDTGIYTDYPAPTQSLLAKWLREEHNLHINICSLSMNCFSFMLEKLDDTGTTLCGGHLGKINYKTYEEALESGLQEALKLINNK